MAKVSSNPSIHKLTHIQTQLWKVLKEPRWRRNLSPTFSFVFSLKKKKTINHVTKSKTIVKQEENEYEVKEGSKHTEHSEIRNGKVWLAM